MKKKASIFIIVLVCSAFLPAAESARADRTDDDRSQLPAPSSAAQKIYSAARNDLLQLRVLLRNGRTQSSVGSGFLIGVSDLVMTNYHVVSQIALEPETYIGEFLDTEGRRGPYELLAVDALHDLAVVRVGRKGSGVFDLPEELPVLTQGQYLYSLGNPLDLGFAISEGSYNGVIKRGFYEQIMFTGPINSGMSGGPTVTVDGRLVGVNVSKRMDGESVSFLVPVKYAQEVFLSAYAQKRPPRDFKDIVGRQLLAHQGAVVDQILSNAFTVKNLGPYRVPVVETDQMRCWGRSNGKEDKMYGRDEINCMTESAIFISDRLYLGRISINHDYKYSSKLGAWRFSALTSDSFKNEPMGRRRDHELTAPKCTEQFINNAKLSLRAVVCVRAYRKFAELYHFTVLTSSADEDRMNLQSRLDIGGVSYDNGLRFAHAFIQAIGREKKR